MPLMDVQTGANRSTKRWFVSLQQGELAHNLRINM